MDERTEDQTSNGEVYNGDHDGNNIHSNTNKSSNNDKNTKKSSSTSNKGRPKAIAIATATATTPPPLQVKDPGVQPHATFDQVTHGGNGAEGR